MKILILTTCEYNKDLRINPFEFDQALSLSGLGNDVRIFAHDFRSIKHLRKIGYGFSNIKGIKVYYASFFVGRLLPFSLRTFISRIIINNFFKLIQKQNWVPEVIHSHFIDTSFLYNKIINRLKRDLNFRYIITEHSSKLNALRLKKTIKKLTSSAYDGSDYIISVSNSLKNNLLINSKINSIVIPNMLPIELENFKIRKIPSKEFSFVITANLVPIKNHYFLFEAFSLFLEKYNAKLFVFGDGILRKN